MKIVHVLWSLAAGGIETMAVNVANAQAAAGHSVALVVVNDLLDGSLVAALSQEADFLCLGRSLHSRSPAFVLRLNRTLSRTDPDIIHLHRSEIYGMILSRRLRRRTCVTLHSMPGGSLRAGGLPGRLVPSLGAFGRCGSVALIDLAPKVFAVSRAVHDELLSRYGVESTVVDNGVDTGRFLCRDLRIPEPAAESLGGRRCGFRIVSVGRLVCAAKGQDLLLEALALLRRGTPCGSGRRSDGMGDEDSPAGIFIAGDGLGNSDCRSDGARRGTPSNGACCDTPSGGTHSDNTYGGRPGCGLTVDFIGDGPDMDRLRELAASLGVGDSVRFRGGKSQRHLMGHLRDYDLYVHSSRIEAFGLTVVEAMAARVPVLVPSGDGPEEICSGERFGSVFRSGDARDLALRIAWIRSHYDEALRKAGAARDHVAAAYDVSLTARRYIEEYSK